jgi:hypothetical protein
MTKPVSSSEHIERQLVHIRGAVAKDKPSERDWRATVNTWAKSLQVHDPRDIEDAATRWAEDHERWPSLSLFLAEVRRSRDRREPRAPSQAAPWQPTMADLTTRKPPVIRDPSRMSMQIAAMKADPVNYVAGDVLARIGEDMLREAGLEEWIP